jgi:hypothetical protein
MLPGYVHDVDGQQVAGHSGKGHIEVDDELLPPGLVDDNRRGPGRPSVIYEFRKGKGEDDGEGDQRDCRRGISAGGRPCSGDSRRPPKPCLILTSSKV